MKTKYLLFLSLFLSLLIYSCSTQKDKFLNRTYHKTATNYNGYFNAKESFKEAVLKLENTHQENYNNILPTTILGDQKQAQKIYPQLNRAIDKGTAVIEHHSMEIKGSEKNKWIDDCYFLIGKALFYKQEYSKAVEIFEFINREYEGYVTNLSLLWNARTQLELGNFNTAEKQLIYLEREVKLKKQEQLLLAEINANYHLKKENWAKGILHLSNAIDLGTKKKKKTRYTFIIGQLHQKLKNYDSAYEAFDKVIRMSPDYEMLFNALLSRARAFNPKNKDSSRLISDIKDLLKDEKNSDYKDQIYFALAEISLKENLKDLAIQYLISATGHHSGNDQVHSIAHLTLADLYFEDSKYLSAQVHYDTALTFLRQDHPDFDLLSKKRNSLNDLVKLYNTIHLQDSLYNLSSLEEEELKALIDGVIEKKKEQDRLAKDLLRGNSGSGGRSRPRNQSNPMMAGGGWYFYNPSAISFGYSEFITKWGERRAEDNWRRANKNQIITDENGELEQEEKDLYSPDYYMSLIPFSDSAKASVINIIVESYYQLGLIYKEDLKDYLEAINTFETLVETYPNNIYEALTYYQLYSCWDLIGDDKNSAIYIQKLTNKYPQSDYLEMIKDPEAYHSKNKEEIDSAFISYENIFTLFNNQKYQDVLLQDSLVQLRYPNHEVLEQLCLLKALSMGHLFGEDSLVSSLNKLIKTYYSGEVHNEAKEILSSLEERSKNIEETLFTFDQKEEHYYILAIENDGPNINKTKILVSDFNSLFYKIEQYKTQSLMLDVYYQLIIVRTFENKNYAMNYLDAIKSYDELKELMGASDYEHFIISSSNFKSFYKEKSLNNYLLYFERKYLK